MKIPITIIPIYNIVTWQEKFMILVNFFIFLVIYATL